MDRDAVRRLARQAIERGDATGWFEALYQRAHGSWQQIPWVDLVPNPHLVEWLPELVGGDAPGRCLVVGCGLGDDAEALAAAGFQVLAFDVSATAIDGCRARFPQSRVEYAVADLLAPPRDWQARFELVVEAYTLQVLPPPERRRAMAALAAMVEPGGRLFVLCRARDRDEPPGELPWPLSRDELAAFAEHGLHELRVEDFVDRETPPVRRFRALYAKS